MAYAAILIIQLFEPLASPAVARSIQASPPPHLVTRDGHHALIVDGAPFLMLGAQANNSSNYPAPLAKVWPVVDAMGANTLEMPVAWQQIEPVEGRWDFSWPAHLLDQARLHHKRLVLLWFGAWKNTAPGYAPDWVKLNPTRFPHMITAQGTPHYALTPLAPTTLIAEQRAFVALMHWLAAHDRQNTVIMMQVDNESGAYNCVRDFSPQAQALFAGPAPAPLLARFGKPAGATWQAAFGSDADEYFAAWAMASHLDALARAGKAIKPLPMYANAALAGAFGRQPATTYASGGPVHHVIDVYKVAAPSLDFVAPDIYVRDDKAVEAYLGYYGRADNALVVPEIGNDAEYARYFYAMMGHGGIGFAPFGMDATGYVNHPLGTADVPAALPWFARTYHLFAPMQRIWADAIARGAVWGAAEPVDPAAAHTRTIAIGPYRATIGFGHDQFGTAAPVGNPRPTGGVAIAGIGPDTFLVTGFDARVEFSLAEAAPGRSVQMLRVEEGHYDAHGHWVFERVWNGDQTDYGLNFTNQPHVLRVRLVIMNGGAVVPVGMPN